jgi:enoyl-CoA hydratase/carnithine racemase
MGLITGVVDDPVSTSFAFAKQLAAKSPDAIRGIKSLVNEAWQLSEAEALALEARLQGDIIGGQNQREAAMANLEKRSPNFKD